MAEKIDLTEIQKQLDELKDDTKVPRWWENQKTNWEERVMQMETNNAETLGYMRQIISLLKNEAGGSEPNTPGQTTSQSAKILFQKMEKKPVQVTVIEGKEKYNMNLDGPGIFSSSPIPPNDVKPQNHDKAKISNEGMETGGTSQFKEQVYNGGNSSSQNIFTPRPRIELQVFDGENPRGWLRKCHKYFAILEVPDHQRLDVAAMYLTGRAETWFDGYILQKHRVEWHEFEADLCHRFCTKESTDIVQEFNKLVQKSTVEEYQDRFEELKPYMLMFNSTLGEDYFVSSFISGLKEEIRNRIMVHEPKTLAEAYRKARRQELVMELENRKFRYPTRMNANIQTQPPKSSAINYTTLQKPQTTVTSQKQALLDYRRTNNLCFKCGDKFSPGHQCKVKQLNVMEEEDDQGEEDAVQEACEGTCQEITGMNTEGELEISINALTGNIGHSTLRIQGTIKGKPLNILVDSGSTHSFVTSIWAKEGLEVIDTKPLAITVANGEKLYSSAKSMQLEWRMEGHQFAHDFRVLKMGGSDMVLGVDWMRRYSPITMDFNAMTLSFTKDQKDVVLHGGKGKGGVKFISGEKLQRLTEKDSELMGEMYLLSCEEAEVEVPSNLKQLLDKYEEVFSEPKGMPPVRSQDHAIILKADAQPVNLRPYRFPHHQKAEVEKQISEMLASSIIQTSKSPFASPCLLVKNKDGSWRLCVDYRQLNAMTVKNKFPIPIVEDLLDELSGAKIFSKIDLRSGYWQIRIKPEDIEKTAFRTHHGHFEFKVMPFGLTNAPATFQSLMNQLFGAYLRKFVLVFFDDILVYSKSWDEHVRHLSVVLELLKTNQLYAKRSKCFFGQNQVEYLGHIISEKGVQTDPSKVDAMKDWPLPKNLKALRGFLGLTGYYRKFVKGYGALSKPLTLLLKKDNF
ncbi:hypothetical protein HRI_002333700 [Hibiscus trionum]|uniref:Reverse transcriptase domain-containing protein n=1 Tax=Hibiscus trionum TaxID=183268 RepID=A0A9W7M3K5_HIBTR|nr:hypothetical protein HRI_002333700 [Hibiscus trionum]